MDRLQTTVLYMRDDSVGQFGTRVVPELATILLLGRNIYDIQDISRAVQRRDATELFDGRPERSRT
jgi:hypothetical protein